MTAAQVSDQERGLHALLFYWRTTRRHDEVAAWIHRGLRRGEQILCCDVPGDTGLVPALTRRGVDVSAAARLGQFRILSPAKFFPSGGQIRLVEAALEEGYSGVVLSAHANEALLHLGEEEYQVVDRQLDELCTVRPVSALCQYDLRRPTASSLDTIVGTHPDGVTGGELRTRRLDDRLSLAGELDLSSAEIAAGWLRHACQRAGLSAVILDLSGLTFVDVAGCRALVTGTASFREQDGRVIVLGVEGHIHTVLTLVGMDRFPGVELP